MNEEQYWNNVASKYNVENLVGDNAKMFLWNNLFTQLKIKELNQFNFNGKSVLDAGCGGGRFINYFKSKGAKVVGIDFSDEMIKVASFLNKDIELKVAPIYKIPYPDKSFDYVVVLSVFMHIVNDEKFKESLKELKRVVKPNGKIIIVDNFPSKNTTYKPKGVDLDFTFMKIREDKEYDELGKSIYEAGMGWFLLRLPRPFELMHKASIKLAYKLDTLIRFGRFKIKVWSGE